MVICVAGEEAERKGRKRGTMLVQVRDSEEKAEKEEKEEKKWEVTGWVLHSDNTGSFQCEVRWDSLTTVFSGQRPKCRSAWLIRPVKGPFEPPCQGRFLLPSTAQHRTTQLQLLINHTSMRPPSVGRWRWQHFSALADLTWFNHVNTTLMKHNPKRWNKSGNKGTSWFEDYSLCIELQSSGVSLWFKYNFLELNVIYINHVINS